MKTEAKSLSYEFLVSECSKIITSDIRDVVKESMLELGTVTIFVPAKNVSVHIIDRDDVSVENVFSRFPQEGLPDSSSMATEEKRESEAIDASADNKLVSCLFDLLRQSKSVVIPFSRGELALSLIQHVVLANHQRSSKKTRVLVNVMGA